MEDVLLGLCGLLQAIWVLTLSLPSKEMGHLRDAVKRVLLIETLDVWKYELGKIISWLTREISLATLQEIY